MKITKTLGLLALAVCMAACTNKKSGDGKADGGFTQPAPTGKPVGQFTGQAGDLNEVSQYMYCSFGQGDAKFVVDSRLQAGMKFESQESWLAEGGGYSGRGYVGIEIVEADNAATRLQRKFTFMDKPDWWYAELCSSTQDNSVECEPQQFSPSLVAAIETSKKSQKKLGRTVSTEEVVVSQYCSFDYATDLDSSENKYETGKFTSKSGKEVAAYRKFEKWKGTYDCGNGRTGTGVRMNERIVSKDVPNPDLTCDKATRLFDYEVIKADDGTIVMERQEELFSF